MRRSDQVQIIGLLAVAVGMVYGVSEHTFFWDTIQLGSKHAHWYYENNFSYFLLPDEIDSGHPPTFGLYLAAIWKVMGKSLLSSHFAMLPFIFGILAGVLLLGRYYGGASFAWWLLAIVILDPVMAGQLCLVSPDIVLLFFFLLGWLAILHKQHWLTVTATIGMALLSTRGMMVVVALYLFDVLVVNSILISGKNDEIDHQPLYYRLLYSVFPYVPSGLLALAFLGYHYYAKGWIGYHADSPWAPAFVAAEGMQLLKNIAVLAWRYLDFGRFIVWGILIGMLVAYWKSFRFGDSLLKQNISLFLISTILLSITFVRYTGLHSHRYLLPAFISLNVLVYIVILKAPIAQWAKHTWLALAFVGLATGNCWIYPDKISQDWDCTLAHLPYYSMRQEMLQYLNREDIGLDQVGTAFPDIGPLKFKDLSAVENGMHQKDLQTDSLVLYSNIMNDFTDEEIDELRNNWQIRHQLKRSGIKFILYAR
jgi:hypothetical protein